MIVDDNLIARTTLKQFATQITDLNIVGECSDAIEAYNQLQTVPLDLLLLDIEMPGMTGPELTQNLGNKKPIIIFITSKREYAVERSLRPECGGLHHQTRYAGLFCPCHRESP